jgi:hypothetical protein
MVPVTATIFDKLDQLTLCNNTSWLLHIMRTYLDSKDVLKVCDVDKRVPLSLRQYARLIAYQETCPVCTKGVWTYHDKKRLSRNIQNCWEYRDRLRAVPCPNNDCERWSIYNYIQLPTNKLGIVDLIRFEKQDEFMSMSNKKWFRVLDENTRQYFVGCCKAKTNYVI